MQKIRTKFKYQDFSCDFLKCKIKRQPFQAVKKLDHRIDYAWKASMHFNQSDDEIKNYISNA